MKNLSWKKRLGVVASAAWFVWVVAVVSKEGWDNTGAQDFFMAGVLPLVVLWGIAWIVSGFNKSKKTA